MAFIENGSWAPTSGKLMREIIAPLKNMTIIEGGVTLKSTLKESQLEQIDALADAIAATLPKAAAPVEVAAGEVDKGAFRNLTYGLFILTAREGDKDNGCVINTLAQITTSPNRISICVNKGGLTHDMILRTGVFNVSVLTEKAPFSVYQHFGFQTGRDTDKFADPDLGRRSANGVKYLTENVNSFVSGKVISAQDYGTHTLFIADVTEAQTLSKDASVTYAYYHAHVKPRSNPAPEKKKGFVCTICGYVYEGDTLPEDFICPGRRRRSGRAAPPRRADARSSGTCGSPAAGPGTGSSGSRRRPGIRPDRIPRAGRSAGTAWAASAAWGSETAAALTCSEPCCPAAGPGTGTGWR